jgi:16S rRNA (guanine527-N7)-methyltransferase
VHNLTRVPEEDWVGRHVVDSTAPLHAGWKIPARVLDMGTGPGFPGIPLAAYCPDSSFDLVESKTKVTLELSNLLKSAGESERIRVFGTRLEELGREEACRERYGLVITRALAAMPVLIELGVPFLQLGGRLWCWKSDPGELESCAKALAELEAQVGGTFAYRLPGESGERWLIEVIRTGPLQEKYPRRAGIPQKRPLS